MAFSTIVCLDDLTRIDTWAKSELVFDLVRLPIFQSSGHTIGRTPHRPQPPNLKAGFTLARFRQLCEQDGNLPGWHELHHSVPEAAADYLLAHLDANALVLGHAMPPWLLKLLDGADIAYVDLCMSPLRFGQDLMVGLRTNRAELHQRICGLALSAEQVLVESSQMAARLRLQRRKEGQLRLPNNPCIFIGQTEDDPALVRSDGVMVRAADFSDILVRLAETGPMMYLPHPQAGDFARIERESIERAIGRHLPICELDTYDLLACDDELMLLGLNAESLQESSWFGRPAYALCPLPTVPAFGSDSFGEGYLQLAPQTLMSERLWATLLQMPLREQARDPEPRANLMRELCNDWWGYASATLRNHGAHREAYALAGGLRQADALRRCEAELANQREQFARMAASIERLNALLERQARTIKGLAHAQGDTDVDSAPVTRVRRSSATGTNGATRKSAVL